MTASTADRTTASEILGAIAPLVEAGLAVHWLHERSKRPIGEGWQNAAVATLAELEATYRPGNNAGVRLGEPSCVVGSYVHAIDIDIRDPDQADDAWAALRKLLPVDPLSLPSAISGSGGHSRHLYFVTSRPFYSRKLWVSEGKHRAGDGRWRYDFEIELLGTGKQVVVAPSIHPDTLNSYEWERPLDLDLADLGLPCAPAISADHIANLTEAVTDTFEYDEIDPLTFRPGQIEAELREVPDSRIDDYHDWIALGQALHHQFGASDRGFALWLQHSKRSEKFAGERDLRSKWRGFGRSRRAPVTMASIRQWVLDARRERMLSQFDEVEASDGGSATTVSDDDLLGDEESADDEIASAGSETRQQAEDWKSRLHIREGGGYQKSLHNLALIVENDPRCKDILSLNLLSDEIVVRKTPKPWLPARRQSAKPVVQLHPALWEVRDKVNGEPWRDRHDRDLRRILEAPTGQCGYGFSSISDRDMIAAIDLTACKFEFHPIRDYLNRLVWDGQPRCDALFTDYLGAPDDAYHRSVARLAMVAGVARVFEPGMKFDQVIILEGGQGIRKSTFISILGRQWAAELNGDFSNEKQMLELLRGKWIIEIPELAGFKGTDVRHLKAFISRREDRARLVYDRRTSTMKRQCILWASTNETQYLVDVTGNRRWWPVKCRTESIDTDRLAREIDQIWAEAKYMYDQMRVNQPTGDLPLYLADAEAAAIASELQDSRRLESVEDSMVGQIEAWLNLPVSSGGFDDEDGKLRVVTCQAQIWQECLGNAATAPKDKRQALQIGKAMSMIEGWESGKYHTFPRPIGRQRSYWRKGYSALSMVTKEGTADIFGKDSGGHLRLVQS